MPTYLNRPVTIVEDEITPRRVKIQFTDSGDTEFVKFTQLAYSPEEQLTEIETKRKKFDADYKSAQKAKQDANASKQDKAKTESQPTVVDTK